MHKSEANRGTALTSSRVARREFVRRVGALLGLAVTPRFPLFGQDAANRSHAPLDMLTPRARQAITRGLEYLVSRQNEDGSFGTGDYARNVAVCSLCGMAFLAEGSNPDRGRFADTVSRCLKFVLSQAAASGLIHSGEESGREPMYGHGFATLFLAEVHGTSREPVRDPLSRAVQLIVQAQNQDGGWRYEPRPREADVSVTVCQVMALRAARNAGLFVPNETIDRSVAYLKRAQNPDGGFLYMLDQPGESSFPRSAAAVVALMSAGLYDTNEVQIGVKYLRDNRPPLKTLAGQSYFLYGQYYAAQALWNVGGEAWQTWYTAHRDFLIAQQEKDGSWYEAISGDYSTAMACLILQMPNNYLPIFQR